MKSYIGISISLILLLGYAQVSAAKLAKKSEADLIVDAQRQVADLMKDPESTKFRKSKIVKGDDSIDTLCGEINSKNSYGGYVGFKSFAVAVINRGQSITVVPDLLSIDEGEGLPPVYRKKCGLDIGG